MARPRVVPRLRDLLAGPATATPTLVLVTQHLPAEHAALSVRRTAARRPPRDLGRLPHVARWRAMLAGPLTSAS
ncbi:MAG TPA: hypothetical protein VH833_00105, partial [Gemmatimonadales bacterium]